ncbi:anthranilate synthase component I family protein [Kurthia huakuii]|uniref:anthranilate synthase component I family protein n=1 Tax=Kurthia huakuii TaxID=1421019 RepID=UPI0004AD76A6|nr:anthranilate synthase component I family protein [Kurthia huakuii]MBM7700446.1 para-aminobenzoate synthetase component 1 [Kurthia huakuii]
MKIIQSNSFSLTPDAFFYGYKNQTAHLAHHIFLESGRGGKQSIAAWNPLAIVQAVEDGIEITWRDGRVEQRQGEALQLAEDVVATYRTDCPHDYFYGGAVGFITYDYVRKIEAIPDIAVDDLHVPDIFFYIVDHWTVFDVKTNTARVMKLEISDVDVEQAARAYEQAATAGLAVRKFNQTDALAVEMDNRRLKSMSGTQFEAAVSRIQDYIAAGDVFQVNLSVRQEEKLEMPPIDVYEALRTFNPSPYMSYIASPTFAVASGSPELLIQKSGDGLSTRPIAGTRPRGVDDAEDLALAQELIDNEKERAEHVMLVDLERNDLGRVAEYGSVHVDEFMVIEKYSHVQHIVSNVRGTARKDQTNADMIRAVFPGGTITGAPKIRTMEIIEELEPVRRGLYTGSIGWLGFNGDFDMNIVIRTAYIQQQVAYIQAGAGIVIDSVPEREYIESLNKAKAMWQAKQMAEA